MKTEKENAIDAAKNQITYCINNHPQNCLRPLCNMAAQFQQAIATERVRYDELRAEFKILQETARCHYAREKQLEKELEEQCKALEAAEKELGK